MADIIQLLPDNIANQIAAGEVIQRPASAVKELLENAVDAGATEIKLLVNDAGKALIQVIDNGKGMSEMDARMCFERHATSKIKSINDLFSIQTMGFRGEALASIAAVAQVHLKTKRAEDAAGVLIEVENSAVVQQQPIATENGTSIAMKNLFFNVPARRNFLKSNSSELRHIVDEFTRVAMSFPHIFFSLSSNGQQVFHLPKGTLKQRVVQILGNSYASKLVTVQEQTDYLNISGFVGKPETAKKTRGDQYFFVNNRFIKSAYLNHAVMKAYDAMIPRDSYPMYTLFIQLDPANIDINVHPTKQEIKFDDERIVYAFVESAVKHALAQFSITPTLDFELDAGIQSLDAVTQPAGDQIHSRPAANLLNTFSKKGQAHFIESKSELKHWRDVYETQQSEPMPAQHLDMGLETFEQQIVLTQLHAAFIVVPTADGYLLVHQQNAHERILYEQFTAALQGKPMVTQQSLFPAQIQLSATDAVLLQELLPDMQQLGYQISALSNNAFAIQGTPAGIADGNEIATIEKMLEQFKHFSSDLKYSKREKLLRSMSLQQSIKAGVILSEKEMKKLVDDLFACSIPNTTAGGKPTYMAFYKKELDKMFGR